MVLSSIERLWTTDEPIAANVESQQAVDCAGNADAFAPPDFAGRSTVRSEPQRAGACHGELNNKPGAAWLEGQPAVYLRSQIDAFASGARSNDIDAQMRPVARAMTPAEIAAAANFYVLRQ